MRLNDWMMRLEALHKDRLHRRFSFGEHDCCMWACDVVQSVTGVDPVADLRGTYGTADEAAAVMQAGGGLEQMAADRFGPEIKPVAAQSGDVGLIETVQGPALVACVGLYWLGAAAFGLCHVPDEEVKRAWRCEVN